ncbi:thioredoxin-2-like [Daphnia pulex]|uniref:thioredoxin-2-like n=1 Tax=Daphnia pulex TaxID=6669 RepID=UPI001EDFC787|nr:thioredoxin-2-like [Daphnia pulex]XP_046638781.1 thioredoxin-2-like [Daphnia pulicaria]
MVYQVKDKQDFNNQLKEAGGKLVVVDFYATWCGPCKMIAPKIEAMSKEMPNVVFVKVDVDECEDVASEYNISCMPTFLYLKNGVKVAEFSGANEDQLRKLIDQHK